MFFSSRLLYTAYSLITYVDVCVYVQISVLEGEVKRLLDKLDHVVTGPLSSDGRTNDECPQVRCDKVCLLASHGGARGGGVN